MTDKDDQRERFHGLSIVWTAVGVTLLPIFYFLSIGPAIWLHLPESFFVVYQPLSVLYKTFPTIQPFMDWYADLWQ
jgi:hypothetical protein